MTSKTHTVPDYFAIFVLAELQSGPRVLTCLLYYPSLVPLSYLFVEDLYCGPHPLWGTSYLHSLSLPGIRIREGFFFALESGYSAQYQ